MNQQHTSFAPTTQTACPQIQVLGTSRGLLLSGLGGVVLLTNKTLAAVADFAIALQDLIVPDVDLEPNGDELDGNGAEDDFGGLGHKDGPGCTISDNDRGAEEAGEQEEGV
jgi:hypothetical protein